MKINNEISPGMCVLSESDTTVSIMAPFDNANPGNFVMETKKCYVCKKDLPISNFRLLKTRRYYSYCKKCARTQANKYLKSKSGVVHYLLQKHKTSKSVIDYDKVSYTFKELESWCLSQTLFHEIYNRWVASGYDKWIKPSIDRLDDYKGYSFDNIQLMTWGENATKGHRDRRNGINNKHSKAVLQYDLDGNFIKEYYSIMQAGRETGVFHGGISQCCMCKYKHAGKYIWKYKL